MEFIELIKAPKVDNVILRRPLHPKIEGTLCLTGHHLILSNLNFVKKEDAQEFWLLHRNVDVIERKPSPQQFTGGSIIIKCKDFAVLTLDFGVTEDFVNVADSIEALANLDVPALLYPFFFRSLQPIVEDGWDAFTVESEFSKLVLNTDDWRISYVNKGYKVCDSYPEGVVVPRSIPDEVIATAATFRQGGRFPVLSYRHDNGAVLLRSGQPLVGPSGKRCKEDERLINAVLGPGRRGYIVDTRTQTLAQTAKVVFDWSQSRGGGFELEIHYPQWRRVHKPIDRHHNLLDSLAKLIEGCNDTSGSMDKWLGRLESSNWLSNVRDTLNCACLVAQCMDQEKLSVLAHGTDGTDTTLAVTSLSQVILNPDCRTIRGFEALIEREWIQGGYPFGSRHFHGVYAYSASTLKNPKRKYAPTFLLFLDCIWQLFSQFPCSFQFQENFIITIFNHSYASQYGTFVGDSVAERESLELRQRTVSLWSYINRTDVIQTYMNPLYEPNPAVIWPSVAPPSVTLWSGLFLRWVVDQTPAEKVWAEMGAMKEKEMELKRTAIKLRKELLDLEKKVKSNGESEEPLLNN